MENKYEQNGYREQKVISRFIKVPKLYETHLKIATKEYVKFLNSRGNAISVNLGTADGQTFAIKKGNEYVVNERLVKQSLKKAKKGQLRTFGFFAVNIVLDKLEEALSNRK